MPVEHLRDKALPLLEELIERNRVDLEGSEIPVHIFTECRHASPIACRRVTHDFMAGYTSQVICILLDRGSTFVRQGRGDHEIWYSPITNRRFPVDANCE